MNNSLARLIDGMVATLRKEVIPRVEGDYARGQAFGVIYMLNSLKLRCSWSNAFLVEQLRRRPKTGESGWAFYWRGLFAGFQSPGLKVYSP